MSISVCADAPFISVSIFLAAIAIDSTLSFVIGAKSAIGLPRRVIRTTWPSLTFLSSSARRTFTSKTSMLMGADLIAYLTGLLN